MIIDEAQQTRSMQKAFTSLKKALSLGYKFGNGTAFRVESLGPNLRMLTFIPIRKGSFERSMAEPTTINDCSLVMKLIPTKWNGLKRNKKG